MSFKNFYLAEAGENRSLFGGKIYSKVSSLSKGLTDVTKNIIGKWDETIASLEKKGPLGKKIAASVKGVQGKINYFKEKNPAAYSMLMNIAAGAAGAAAGTAAGKVTKAQIDSFKKYLDSATSKQPDKNDGHKTNKGYDTKKDPDMRDDDNSSRKPSESEDLKLAVNGFAREHGETNAQGLVGGGKKLIAADGAEVVVIPDKQGGVDYYYKGDPKFDNAKTLKSLMQNNSVIYGLNTIVESDEIQIKPEDKKAYSDAVNSVKGLLDNVWSMISTPGKNGGSSMIDKGAVAGGMITALATPSPSVLGAVALQATLNALDKVDKRQMPASRYISTVINKVKDEKKRKEMLASFIRMRSKQM